MCRTKWLALSASVFLLSACGGGGSDGENPAAPHTPSTGVFVDSPVSGLYYQTPTYSGTTNSAGEYDYLPGEMVTFSIGGITLGSALGGPVVSPLTLVSGATDATDPVVTNIVRLLMSLDDDGDPSNGISISAATFTAAAGLSIDFTTADLAADTGIVSLLAALPSVTLVDASVAQSHFATTLAAQSNWGSMSWGSGTWQAAAP